MSNIKPTIQIFNAITGNNEIREMTDEEYAEYEAIIANIPTLPSVE
jgi:hypothetical protein